MFYSGTLLMKGITLRIIDGRPLWFTETTNAAEEGWGECRRMQPLTKSADSCPAEVVQAVFAAADVFAVGAPQQDMTLVVVRVLE